MVFLGAFGCEENEAHEQRQADIECVLRREARSRCFGCKYLGDHELQLHGSIVSQHEYHPPDGYSL